MYVWASGIVRTLFVLSNSRGPFQPEGWRAGVGGGELTTLGSTLLHPPQPSGWQCPQELRNTERVCTILLAQTNAYICDDLQIFLAPYKTGRE